MELLLILSMHTLDAHYSKWNYYLPEHRLAPLHQRAGVECVLLLSPGSAEEEKCRRRKEVTEVLPVVSLRANTEGERERRERGREKQRDDSKHQTDLLPGPEVLPVVVGEAAVVVGGAADNGREVSLRQANRESDLSTKLTCRWARCSTGSASPSERIWPQG